MLRTLLLSVYYICKTVVTIVAALENVSNRLPEVVKGFGTNALF